jgi:hypothetical protein
MGEWRADQSKNVRRYSWGETRGKNDAIWKEFARRIETFQILAGLKFEKIGSEIHCWREVYEPSKDKYWTSCLRFVDDGWGYWTVFYRTDERRWRATSLKQLPMRLALEGAAEFYQNHFVERQIT